MYKELKYLTRLPSAKILSYESIQNVQNVFQTFRKNCCFKEIVIKAQTQNVP